jgi:hypothetical protein
MRKLARTPMLKKKKKGESRVGLLIDTRFCHVVALSCACEAKNQKKGEA